MSNKRQSLLSALDASSSTPEKGWHTSNLFSKTDMQGIDKWPASHTHPTDQSNANSHGKMLYQSPMNYGKHRPTILHNAKNVNFIRGTQSQNHFDTGSCEIDGSDISLMNETSAPSSQTTMTYLHSQPSQKSAGVKTDLITLLRSPTSKQPHTGAARQIPVQIPPVMSSPKQGGLKKFKSYLAEKVPPATVVQHSNSFERFNAQPAGYKPVIVQGVPQNLNSVHKPTVVQGLVQNTNSGHKPILVQGVAQNLNSVVQNTTGHRIQVVQNSQQGMNNIQSFNIVQPTGLGLAAKQTGNSISNFNINPTGQLSTGYRIPKKQTVNTISNFNIQSTGQMSDTTAILLGETNTVANSNRVPTPQNAKSYPEGTLGLFHVPNSPNPVYVMYDGSAWVEVPKQDLPNPKVQVVSCNSPTAGHHRNHSRPVNLIEQRLPEVQSLLQTRDWKHSNLSRRPLHSEKPDSSSDAQVPKTTSNIAIATVPLATSSSDTVTSSSDTAKKAQEVEEPEMSKDGRMLLCPNCGVSSRRLDKCESCRRIIPKTAKVQFSGQPLPQTKPPIVISKQDFYGKKLQEQSQPYGTIMNFNMVKVANAKGKVLIPVAERLKTKAGGRPKKRPLPAEPEMVTISSDEDDSPAVESPIVPPTVNANAHPPQGHHLTRRQRMENEQGEVVKSKAPSRPVTPAPAPDSPQTTVDTPCQQMHIKARNIRLGSFKGVPYKPIKVSDKGMTISMEGAEKTVTLEIEAKDIVLCMAHFGQTMPVLFLLTSAGNGCQIRAMCNMNSAKGPYYDPGSKEECHKHIVILLKEESLTEVDQKNFHEIFKSIAMQHHHGHVIINFIDYHMANQLLIKSTPPPTSGQLVHGGNRKLNRAAKPIDRELEKIYAHAEETFELDRSPSPPRQTFQGPIQKLFVYPPPPAKGALQVTNEDLFCLNEGEFLNDVIIDFYLRYLNIEKLSQEDQKRTHIFSSFFYKRLTGKAHKGSEEPNMTLAQRRHIKVKTWTRHIDIFQKDFIVVPINENSHWFLAIICFPGLDAPVYRKASCLSALQSCYTEDEDSQEIQNDDHKKKVNEKVKNVSESNTTCDKNELAQARSSEIKNADNATSKTSVLSENDMTDNKMADSENKMDDSISEGASGNDVSSSPPCSQEQSEVGAVQSDDNMAEAGMTQDVTMHEEQEPPEQEEPMEEEDEDDNDSERASPSGETPIIVGGIEKQPCILVFDSLAGPSRSSIVRTLRDYLQMEWNTRKKTPRSFNKDTIKGGNPKVPQQDNYSDCGVYICQYVESFFSHPIQDFTIPMKCTKEWFPDELIKGKRKEIINILHKLHKETQDKVS